MVELEITISETEYEPSYFVKATAFKEAGDWLSAINTLYEAKGYLLQAGETYDIETWCKLPLYLQQAGRFEEAMKEFDWLDANVAKTTISPRDLLFTDEEHKRSTDLFLEISRCTIRKKSALAQKREALKNNKSDKAACGKIRSEYTLIIDRETQRERALWEALTLMKANRPDFERELAEEQQALWLTGQRLREEAEQEKRNAPNGEQRFLIETTSKTAVRGNRRIMWTVAIILMVLAWAVYAQTTLIVCIAIAGIWLALEYILRSRR